MGRLAALRRVGTPAPGKRPLSAGADLRFHVRERGVTHRRHSLDPARVAGFRPTTLWLAHSPLQSKYEADNVLDLPEPLRIEREGYFNPAIRCPVNVEHEPRGGKLDQAEPEVSGIPVRLVCFDVANTTIIVLELALDEEVGLHWR
jgi:hypothetical protein